MPLVQEEILGCLSHDGKKGNEKDEERSTDDKADEDDTGPPTLGRLIAFELEARGYVAEWMESDGNCLFRSLSQGEYGTQERHHEVRQQIFEAAKTSRLTDIAYPVRREKAKFLRQVPSTRQ